MKTAYEFLLEIKNTPELFLGEKSFEKLYFFIYGYDQCLSKLFNENYDNIYKKFDAFIKKYYHIKSDKIHLINIMIYKNLNDRYAFDMFFKLIEIFFKKNLDVLKEEVYKQKEIDHKIISTSCSKRDIYYILSKIEHNYEQYLGYKSFNRLSFFIAGYFYFISNNFNPFPIQSNYEFESFIMKYYKIKKLNGNNWKNIIIYKTKNDDEAFNQFYKLLKLFVKKI